MVVLACWFCALLVDPQVRWRRTGLEWPIGALVAAMLLSMAANIDRVNAAGQTVVKNFTFFASYLLIVYFIVERHPLAPGPRPNGAAARGRRHRRRASPSLVEWKTTTNLFNWYGHVMPFLHYVDEGVAQSRGSGVRARGVGAAPDRAERGARPARAARLLPLQARPPAACGSVAAAC